MAKRKFSNIGTMLMSKKKNPEDKNEKRSFYIKLEQNKKKDGTPYGEQLFPITLANGKKILDGESLSLFSKREKFQELVDEGKMTQEKADELSAFLLFDVCVSEPVDEGGGPASGSDEIPF